METPDLKSIRRFALVIALVLTTLVLAQVELESPVRVTPLGIPLIIRRPDLLTVALVVASVYATLRYIYYGMLVQPSPMRARRSLLSGKPLHTPTIGLELEEFVPQVEKEIDRYFPKIGRHKAQSEASQGSGECHIKIEVPVVVRAVCWIENIDFLLPIAANCAALLLWGYARATGS